MMTNEQLEKIRQLLVDANRALATMHTSLAERIADAVKSIQRGSEKLTGMLCPPHQWSGPGHCPVCFPIMLDDPVLYKKTMTYPLTFEIFAMTENYEEYTMQIVAKTDEQANVVAKQLCETLGLIMLACTEADEQEATPPVCPICEAKITHSFGVWSCRCRTWPSGPKPRLISEGL